MAKQKREALYYIIGVGLLLIALVVNIYLFSNAGAPDETWLASQFNFKFFDLLGLALFNLGMVWMSVGMFGNWQIWTNSGAAINRAWALALALSIFLIYL